VTKPREAIRNNMEGLDSAVSVIKKGDDDQAQETHKTRVLVSNVKALLSICA